MSQNNRAEEGEVSTSLLTMKTMEVCPVCHGNTLEQDLKPVMVHSNRGLGSHVTYPPKLDGCHCSSCGTKFVFNKKGICPVCNGNGQFEEKTFDGVVYQSSTFVMCVVCKGTGRIR